ncbi:MAG: hypothetical protein WCT13_05520 [Patescibacteria group bacterium]
MRRMEKPVYMGSIAIEIGYGLNRTQHFIDNLVDENIIREVTLKEKSDLGVNDEVLMYVLRKKSPAV